MFYAAALGGEAREVLHAACSRLENVVPFARWTHPADYHVTVKFIGDVAPALTEQLADPIRSSVTGMGSFALSLDRFGSFGRGSSPEILWCGIAGTDPLRVLHERVDRAAAACGIALDTRPFRAHITVARKYRGNTPFTALLGQLADLAPAPCPWQVKELVLYRTNFGERPAYEAIARFPL